VASGTREGLLGFVMVKGVRGIAVDKALIVEIKKKKKKKLGN
jgi:hypothetical protein